MRYPRTVLLWACVLSMGLAAAGTGADLNAVLYPDKDKVSLGFSATSRAPKGRLMAEVLYRNGQAEIDLTFEGLKSPVLFGGDVNAYVLWAVTRDGGAENLGEVWDAKGKGSNSYSTGKKVFALMVTAESTYLAVKPSELAMFLSLAPADKRFKSTPFTFSDFAPAPAHDLETIADYEYSGKTPLEVLQAERVYDLAERSQGAVYAPDIMRDAKLTLAQARALSLSKSNRKGMVDYARRCVALSTDAMRTAQRRLEGMKLEEEIARRKAEMETLQAQAEGSQQAAREAQEQKARLQQELQALSAETTRAREAQTALARDMKQLQEEKAMLIAIKDGLARDKQAAEAGQADLQTQKALLLQEMEALRRDKEAMETATQDLVREKEAAQAAGMELQAQMARAREQLDKLQEDQLEAQSSMARLEESRAGLERSIEALAQEKERMSQRLQGALQMVAETKQSARGLIVNLPDILFDFNRATLKEPSRVTLAKLAGILLIMPELNLRAEGHTDAVGGEEYNLQLSDKRATAVVDFLRAQGVDAARMTPAGYGMARPIADNGTEAGRAKNRRVEIVIAEGVVREDESPAPQ